MGKDLTLFRLKSCDLRPNSRSSRNQGPEHGWGPTVTFPNISQGLWSSSESSVFIKRHIIQLKCTPKFPTKRITSWQNSIKIHGSWVCSIRRQPYSPNPQAKDLWSERYQSLWGHLGRSGTSVVTPTPESPGLRQLVDLSVHMPTLRPPHLPHQLLPHPIMTHATGHYCQVTLIICARAAWKDRAVPAHFM